MAAIATWRYGVSDALDSAFDGRARASFDWNEWHDCLETVLNEATSREAGIIIEAVIAGLPAGRARDTFVRVLAHHIRNDTWGNP